SVWWGIWRSAAAPASAPNPASPSLIPAAIMAAHRRVPCASTARSRRIFTACRSAWMNSNASEPKWKSFANNWQSCAAPESLLPLLSLLDSSFDFGHPFRAVVTVSGFDEMLHGAFQISSGRTKVTTSKGDLAKVFASLRLHVVVAQALGPGQRRPQPS